MTGIDRLKNLRRAVSDVAGSNYLPALISKLLRDVIKELDQAIRELES